MFPRKDICVGSALSYPRFIQTAYFIPDKSFGPILFKDHKIVRLKRDESRELGDGESLAANEKK